jgi:hypothetical protein
MKSPLIHLLDNLQKRFPNELPVKQTTPEELALLQGTQLVVRYVEEFLHVNQDEVDRDDILRDS